MKHGETLPVPEAAAEVFGERLPRAVEYVAALATIGVERGLIGPRETGRLWGRHILNSAVLGELLERGNELLTSGAAPGCREFP